MEIEKNKTSPYFIPLLIFLLNLVTKSIHLNSRDIALDEPFSIYYGQMSFAEIIEMLYSENNPPLHFFLLHFIIKLFGIEPVSVRFFSMLFSSLTAIVIFKIGDKFFNKIIGIGAGLIFTFSTMHIFFSHEARVYPLFALLTAGSLYFFLKIVTEPELRKNYYWLLILNIFIIYSHYFGFFVLFVEVVSLILINKERLIIKRLTLVMFLIVISYIPMLLIFIHRLGISTGKGTWVALPGITEIYGNLNRFINNRNNTVTLLILFLLAIGLLLYKRKLSYKIKELLLNKYIRIIFAWFIVPYLIMFFVSFKYPMFIDRYILFTSIPFYITIAILLFYFFEASGLVIAAFVIFIFSQIVTVQLNPDNNRRLKEVANFVSKLKNRETLVLLAPDYAFMGFCYYYNIDYFKQAPKTVELLNKDNIFPVSDQETAEKLMEKQPTKKIIYIQAGSEFVDPDNLILKKISFRFTKHKVFHVFEIYEIHYFYN